MVFVIIISTFNIFHIFLVYSFLIYCVYFEHLKNNKKFLKKKKIIIINYQCISHLLPSGIAAVKTKKVPEKQKQLNSDIPSMKMFLLVIAPKSFNIRNLKSNFSPIGLHLSFSRWNKLNQNRGRRV